MNSSNLIKAGVIQFNIENGHIDNNLRQVIENLDELKQQGVNMAVLPEMFSCGFDNDNLGIHAKKTDQVINTLKDYAKKNKMAIAGSLPINKYDKIFNTMCFIDQDGQIAGIYEKIHLFKPTLEHHYFAASDQLSVIKTSFGAIGLSICYDLRFPELFSKLADKGAKIILLSAQWPETRIRHWKILAQARAIENQCFMVLANRTGNDQSLIFSGCSMIVDPMGNIIADTGAEDKLAFAEIDLELLENTRTTLPFLKDRRPLVYGYR